MKSVSTLGCLPLERGYLILSNVTRLKPRKGTFDKALEAYATGDSSLSLELLDGVASSEAAALRARAYMRGGRLTTALSELEIVEADSSLSHSAAAEILILKLYALKALGRHDEAEKLSVEARTRCFSAGNPALEAELVFTSVIGSFATGDLSAAAKWAHHLLSLEPEMAAWVSPGSYGYPLGFWRSRACDVLANIEHDPGLKMAWSQRAIEEFDKAGYRDSYIEASTLANLASAVVQTPSDSVLEFIRARAENFEWNASTAQFEFRVYCALAQAASLAGDQLSALRNFRRCQQCGPTTVLQLQAGLERSRLLREMGESFAAQEEVDHAARLSKSVRWEDESALDQRHLLLLAGEIANFDSQEAKRLLDRFDGLKSSNMRVMIVKDDRSRGEEYFARAAVMRAIDQRERAVILLLDALDIWGRASLDHLAARAAMALAELTREPYYLALAGKEAKKRPLSLLSRTVEAYVRSEAATADVLVSS